MDEMKRKRRKKKWIIIISTVKLSCKAIERKEKFAVKNFAVGADWKNLSKYQKDTIFHRPNVGGSLQVSMFKLAGSSYCMILPFTASSRVDKISNFHICFDSLLFSAPLSRVDSPHDKRPHQDTQMVIGHRRWCSSYKGKGTRLCG